MRERASKPLFLWLSSDPVVCAQTTVCPSRPLLLGTPAAPCCLACTVQLGTPVSYIRGYNGVSPTPIAVNKDLFSVRVRVSVYRSGDTSKELILCFSLYGSWGSNSRQA